MKINRNINTTILTDDNTSVLELLNEEIIINNIEELKEYKTDFLVFNDVLRSLTTKEKETLFSNMESRNIHFINITSNLEECLYAHEIIVIQNRKEIVKGSSLSVLKEERLLKRLGYKLPFIVDLSLQLNAYGLIDSIFLDEEILVNKLW